MLKTLISAGLIFLLIPLAHAATIYQWTENGKTVYGGVPPLGIQAKEIRLERPHSQPDNGTSATERWQQSMERKANQKKRDKVKTDDEKYSQARALNCNKARHNLNVLQIGGRKRVRLSDGSVKYLDEAETSQRIRKATADVDAYCDSADSNS
ncbi:MAG: DUF4124 domain-containing protein [Gammaproteobacteria bacterium]